MQQQQASSRRGLGVLVGGWVAGWWGNHERQQRMNGNECDTGRADQLDGRQAGRGIFSAMAMAMHHRWPPPIEHHPHHHHHPVGPTTTHSPTPPRCSGSHVACVVNSELFAFSLTPSLWWLQCSIRNITYQLLHLRNIFHFITLPFQKKYK